ncbi:MAG TPA: hypothetical protein PLN95_02930 [Candidatus Saccharibacteria bacterium]|nr:hypothetical protein [Candidatus Saccharibacteria bacterium]
MSMTTRNPLSEGAMTIDDVGPGVLFTWYKPQDPSTVKRGVFLSHPSQDGREDHIVSYRIEGIEEVRTTDLCSFGITRSREGQWSDCLTVAREE